MCGRVWIFPAHSNDCFGSGGCSRQRAASTTFQPQRASCCTPVLMQLALLCVCATVRQRRQSDRRVLKRPRHLSELFYTLKINHIPYIRLFSLQKALSKNLRHPSNARTLCRALVAQNNVPRSAQNWSSLAGHRAEGGRYGCCLLLSPGKKKICLWCIQQEFELSV